MTSTQALTWADIALLSNKSQHLEKKRQKTEESKMQHRRHLGLLYVLGSGPRHAY